tara:strand:- start:20 stop:301 length:282 start_codon:yes stop_codon:yes gene_type:complete
MKYKCKKCDTEIQVNKYTLIVKRNHVINKHAICCDQEMECLDKSEGMPTIIRKEYTWQDDIIQHKAKQKEARLKKDGYDKNNPEDRPPKRRIK